MKRPYAGQAGAEGGSCGTHHPRSHQETVREWRSSHWQKTGHDSGGLTVPVLLPVLPLASRHCDAYCALDPLFKACEALPGDPGPATQRRCASPAFSHCVPTMNRPRTPVRPSSNRSVARSDTTGPRPSFFPLRLALLFLPSRTLPNLPRPHNTRYLPYLYLLLPS